MLATSDQLDVSSDSTSNLPMLVHLPKHMASFFQEAGYLETVYCELRGQARLRVRCESILESEFVPPFAGITQRRSKVLIKDLSRSGLGLLSHEQLWPGETFRVVLHGRHLHVRVVRCRKLADSCFEVGGILLSLD